MKVYRRIIPFLSALLVTMMSENICAVGYKEYDVITSGDWTYEVEYHELRGGYYASMEKYN